jgi:hypothetical protein
VRLGDEQTTEKLFLKNINNNYQHILFKKSGLSESQNLPSLAFMVACLAA